MNFYLERSQHGLIIPCVISLNGTEWSTSKGLQLSIRLKKAICNSGDGDQ